MPAPPDLIAAAYRRWLLRALLAVPLWPAAARAAALDAETLPPVRRILMIGDSQAQGLGGGFQRRYRRRPEMRVIDRSKIATGLMPRPNYDWPAEAPKIAAAERADVVVAMFGANDRPLVRAHGQIDPGKRAEFQQEYGDKVEAVIRPFREAGMPVIWVGHPIVRDAVFAEDMLLLDGIYAAASARAGADFVSTWDMFAVDGGYSAFGPGVDGATTRLRADDGVHLTSAGYDVLARAVEAHFKPPEANAAAPAPSHP